MIPENLYSATYSNVPVYEFIHPKSSVMRRKRDGWVNATHILKVANFPKAKRTRILEKGVQNGVHEKVQGGYGKYQGTWVPLERAMAIAKEFNVLDDLLPVFEYHSDGNSTPPPAPKHHHASTGAGGRKKSNRINTTTTTLSAVATAQGSAQNLPPQTRTSTRGRKPKAISRVTKPESPLNLTSPKLNLSAKQNQIDITNSLTTRRLKVSNNHPSIRIRGTESSPIMAISDEDIDDDGLNDENLMRHNNTIISTTTPNNHSHGRHNRLENSPVDDFMTDRDLDNALAESQTYGKGASSLVKDENLLARVTQRNQISSSSRGYQLTARDKQYAKELFQYFELNDSKAMIPNFLMNENEKFNVDQPVDVDGNTTLHLACAMGDIRLCEILIKRNCDIKVNNLQGQIPIFSLVKYSNSYYRGDKNFERFLRLLIDSIFETDTQLHTLLHQIALTTIEKDKRPSARYYTEILLRTMSELNGVTIDSLNSFINKQDINGNTALHIFMENQADRCLRILLEYNARVDINNNKNEMVRDYINKSINYLGVPFDASNPVDSLGNVRVDYNQFQNQLPNQQSNLLLSRESFLNPYQQSLMKYGTYPTSMISPNRMVAAYSSESAMNVVQSSNEIMNKLNELARAFESEVISKENDKRELGGIVDKVDQDLGKSANEIKNILMGLLNINEIDNEEQEIDATFKVKQKLKGLEKEFIEKSDRVKRIIELSQLFRLKNYVETEKLNLLNKEEEFPTNDKDTEDEDDKTVKLGVKLAELQITRKHMINSLVNMMAQGDETRERINRYRRLLATLSNIPLSEIDDNLQSIEDNLRLDSK